MTPKEAERRLAQLELRYIERRHDPKFWQERLELLRIIDRAAAPAERQPEETP